MSPSTVVAIATARQRGLMPLTLIVVAVLLLLALRSDPEAGTQVFSGLSGAWFVVLTLVVGAGLLSEEIESGHAQLVLLRPLTRAQWVAGRFAGAAAIVTAAGAAAWVLAFAMAVARGEPLLLGARLAVLPLALVQAFAWLSVFCVVGAVTPGWSNVGLVAVAYVGWKVLKFTVPLALRQPDLAPVLETIDHYCGPQDSMGTAMQIARGERLVVSPALWNLFGMAAAWLGTVELFKRRELARRRA
ncbi:MAG TPA: ABC transporter permease subunit [Myxococcales bacterium]|nr:ABC transporter permease subunit [Myxococcales bacterium]